MMVQGTRLGHFEVIERIGEGGMGVVYRARDVNLNRLVALKVLATGGADADRRARFVQEAQAASSLNHPNIVTIHEIFREADHDVIAMELIAGQTLDSLPEGKRPRLGDAVRIGEQIAAALAAAHAAGIVHRDLKPSNVMLTADGHVKVLDFGLAKLTERTPAPATERDATQTAVSPHTEAGVIMGTVAYMSPEQAEGRAVDHRTDIFSFGSLMYELIAGVKAFDAPSRVQVMAAVIEREPVPLSERVAKVPRDLERLIGRCLKKLPADRPQNLRDVQHALEDIRNDLSSGRFSASPPGVIAPAPEKQALRRWWPLLLVAALLGAGGAMWFARPKGPPPVFQAKPLTAYPGSEYNGALSPDARQVAFAWDGPAQDNTDIYIRNAASGDPLRLTTHPGRDHAPAWLPSEETILFLRDEPGQPLAVYSIPSLGGTERKICTLGNEANVGGPGARIAPTPDGKSFVVTDDHALSLVLIDTGEKRKLELGVETKGHSHPGSPAISPDGKTIAFVVSDASAGDTVYVASLSPDFHIEAGSRVAMHSRFGAITAVAWSTDSEFLFFIDSREGPARMYRTRLDGRMPARPVPGLGDHITDVSVSGDRMVYTYATQDANLWMLPLVAGGAPQPFAPSTQSEREPSFSPDGKQVAFVSERGGDADIWIAQPDGTQARQLTRGGSVRSTPMWSPDGRELLYTAFSESGRESRIVRVDTGVSRAAGPVGAARPYWSLDGKTIYFTQSSAERYQTFRIPAAAPETAPVLVHPHEWSGMDSPLGEMPGGAGLLVETGAGVLRVPLNGIGEPEPFPAPGARRAFRTADSLFFVDAKTGALMRYRFANRQTTVAAAKAPQPLRDYTVSPDGRTLIYSRVDQRARDLMIVEFER